MVQSLRHTPFRAHDIAITGATGYVGSLMVATLLQHTEARIHCLTRSIHDRAALLAGIWEECQAQGAALSFEALDARIEHHLIPGTWEQLPTLHACLANVDELIHCAGSVDYYDEAVLDSVNVHFTQHLLELGRRLPLKRFVFVSTAFCGGYRNTPTPESLLEEPERDPTYYTRSKRRAEHLVAESGLPFLILRPSILIGTSQTGRYSGKRYGLYQNWMGLERLTCDRYHAEFHVVAPTFPVNFLHQDAFCAAWAAAYAWLPDGALFNMVSRQDLCPSMRDLWTMWFSVAQPRTAFYYPSVEAIPLRNVHARQRAYLTFAQINLEIASHPWSFNTHWLEQLRPHMPGFIDTHRASVQRCQDRFVASSDIVTRFLQNHAPQPTCQTQIIDLHAQHADATPRSASLS
jgi:nucleoside-diphosphate-sugar epimerase